MIMKQKNIADQFIDIFPHIKKKDKVYLMQVIETESDDTGEYSYSHRVNRMTRKSKLTVHDVYTGIPELQTESDDPQFNITRAAASIAETSHRRPGNTLFITDDYITVVYINHSNDYDSPIVVKNNNLYVNDNWKKFMIKFKYDTELSDVKLNEFKEGGFKVFDARTVKV